ncbi:MAG: penicillin-binding protein 2 [Nitrospirota bacterium]|nr:penicillin-binding protein 2 [Nitrospirota bacterium]
MERQRSILVVLVLAGLGFLAVALRLVHLQVIERGDLTRRAERQQEQVLRLEPKRGTIYDRRGRELAVSLDTESVYGVPSEVDDPRSLATRLARVLSQNPAELQRKLASERQFVWISRKADPESAEKAREMNPDAIGLKFEARRFYPKKTLAGTLLGFTNVDNKGIEGVELLFDRELRGEEGWIVAEKDAKGRTVFPGGHGLQYRLPQPGKDLYLTIDEVIQHIAEKELDRGIAEHRARGGVCIVMDPRTGEILALSARSTVRGGQVFNPNSPQRHRPEEWRNRAVTDSFEPGSIFKAITAAAALEERVAHPQERFDCSAGNIRVADRVIKDSHRNGVLTFTDVISQSSNVGTIKIAQRLGKARLAKYIDAFGFGKKTGVDLPGEIAGMVKDHRLWSGVSLASISIGQEIGVTPIQMAAAYSVIANGGELRRPTIVSEIRGPNLSQENRSPEVPAGRVISPETSATLRKILQKVVDSGTGQKAKPAGYTAAGKTGTAQKIDQRTGTYSRDDYVTSFAGFVPAAAPKLVIVVMVDSPVGEAWGSSVAAPVFRAVAEQSLTYLQVPPDDVGGRMLLVAR